MNRDSNNIIQIISISKHVENLYEVKFYIYISCLTRNTLRILFMIETQIHIYRQKFSTNYPMK